MYQINGDKKMNGLNIMQVVKKLEPFFIGYTANENRLTNSNGMELVFRVSWNNKTTICGVNASRHHSIGCSLEKPVEKIASDIRRRLFKEYHKDFLNINATNEIEKRPKNYILISYELSHLS